MSTLRELPNLKVLSLEGNPLSAMRGYRDSVLCALPQLQSLDGRPVDAATRQDLRDAEALRGMYHSDHSPASLTHLPHSLTLPCSDRPRLTDVRFARANRQRVSLAAAAAHSPPRSALATFPPLHQTRSTAASLQWAGGVSGRCVRCRLASHLISRAMHGLG